MVEQMLLTVDQAGAALGIGRSLLLTLVYRGDIVSVKCGRRRLISAKALSEYIAKLEAEQAEQIAVVS